MRPVLKIVVSIIVVNMVIIFVHIVIFTIQGLLTAIKTRQGETSCVDGKGFCLWLSLVLDLGDYEIITFRIVLMDLKMLILLILIVGTISHLLITLKTLGACELLYLNTNRANVGGKKVYCFKM